MSANMDTVKSRTITYEELKSGIVHLGLKQSDAEVKQLMEAVSFISLLEKGYSIICSSRFIGFNDVCFRLMWTATRQSITLKLLLLHCTGISSKETSICLKFFSILTRITVGKT